MAKDPEETTDDEIVPLSVPPVFANNVKVTVIGQFTRLSFGEKYKNLKGKYHSAVVLPTAAMEKIAKMVPELIEENVRANQPTEGQAESDIDSST